jgi:hypothetical protein
MSHLTTCPRCRASLADHFSERKCSLCNLPSSMDVDFRRPTFRNDRLSPVRYVGLLCGLIALCLIVVAVAFALLADKDRATKKALVVGSILTLAVLAVLAISPCVPDLTRRYFAENRPGDFGWDSLYVVCGLVFCGAFFVAGCIILLAFVSPLW